MTSKLASEPVRPSMPIEGRSREAWAEFYDRELSGWFYTCKQRNPTSSEWDSWVDDQFSFQTTLEQTP